MSLSDAIAPRILCTRNEWCTAERCYVIQWWLEEAEGHLPFSHQGYGSQLGRYRPGQLLDVEISVQSTKRRDHIKSHIVNSK
jgi:hypothetical protein